jgi:hypothetical protein
MHAINHYGSMEGFYEYMNSKALVNQKFQAMSSPAALANITLVMVEPGVAGGLHNAMMQTYSHMENMYLSDVHLMQQFALSPAVGQASFEAWTACVAAELKGVDTTGASSGGSSNGKSWIEAQAKCNMDRIVENKQKDRFDDETKLKGYAFNFKAEKAAFDDKADWDKDDIMKLVSGGSSSGAEDRTQSLVGMIFPQPYDADNEDFNLKKAFREMGGDYLIEISGNDEKSEGARFFTYKYVGPTKSLEEWYRARWEGNFEALREGMYTYCDQWFGKDITGDESFYKSDDWLKISNRLSTPTYRFKPSTMELFMKHYKKHGGQYDEQALKDAECKGLKADEAYSYDEIRIADGSGVGGGLPDELARNMAAYADLTAVAQMYGVFMQAQDSVGRMPDSVFPSSVGAAAMSLLNTAVGNVDPYAEYNRVLDKIQYKMLPEYHRFLNKETAGLPSNGDNTQNSLPANNVLQN